MGEEELEIGALDGEGGGEDGGGGNELIADPGVGKLRGLVGPFEGGMVEENAEGVVGVGAEEAFVGWGFVFEGFDEGGDELLAICVLKAFLGEGGAVKVEGDELGKAPAGEVLVGACVC
ncbi:MAG: hypothetical protein S4CHLAM102_07040 [Chlamydiia bacterium]|nr:hypothetical protein [Chlamydiia bacterium]